MKKYGQIILEKIGKIARRMVVMVKKENALTYEPLPYEFIEETARKMVAMANESKEIVKAKFNDIELTANPGDTAEAVVQRYNNERNYIPEGYTTSPEYLEKLDKILNSKDYQEMKLKEALAVAPEKMTFRDEDAWMKYVEESKHSGATRGIITFADRWARLMENCIANGDTVEGCADETSELADSEDISGGQYFTAVSILSEVWIHGDQLRSWHGLPNG